MFDPERLAAVKPGTSFAEVMSLLGPPHHIIDGTRRLLDEEAVWSQLRTAQTRVIPAREIAAPEDTAILVYTHLVLSWSSAPTHFSTHDRKNEVFVFVSKSTLRVTDVAGGR
jgi:hypothetical protein